MVEKVFLKKNLDAPDETESFSRGKSEYATIGDVKLERHYLEPGWKWSEDIKPMAETESCPGEHLVYGISGKLRILMDDGTEGEIGPGDFAFIPKGHDAWVVGDEPAVGIEIHLKG